MTLPVTIPNTFANATSSIPLANLDANFVTIYGAVNGIGNGAEALSNVTITGGTIENAAIGGSTAAAGSFTTLNTSGAVVFNDAGADVDFRVEGNTDANLLFVDASADAVGIGTNAPAQTLHVKTSTSATPITFGVLSNATGLPALSFNGAYASTTMAGIYANGGTSTGLYYMIPTGNNHVFGIADVTKMTLDSSGNVSVANGNLVFSTNGTGIDFSASAGGGASSSLLDDYEEGTWTPTITASTTNPSVTYSAQVGYYTKIGRQVFVQAFISLTARTSGSGDARISGLPFTVANVTQSFTIGTAGQMQNFTSSLGDTDGQIIVIRANTNSTALSWYESNETTGTDWPISNLDNSFFMRLSINYFV
jgi:hypothetical protein